MSYVDPSQHGGYHFPPLTPAIKRLILFNFAVFLANAVVLGFRQGGAIDWLGLSATGLADGYGLGVLRFLSYQFVHDPYGVAHLVSNCIGLYVFGRMAEGIIGYRGVYKLYLVSGFVGGLGHMALASILQHPSVPVIGASGAVYGMILFAAAHRPTAQISLIFFSLSLKALAGFLLFVGFYMVYVEAVSGYPEGVSHGAHLGGALGGYLVYRFGWFVDHVPYAYNDGLIGGFRKRMREGAAKRDAKRQQVRQETMDRLLDKIKDQGMDSLTSAERAFLQKASKDMGGGGR